MTMACRTPITSTQAREQRLLAAALALETESERRSFLTSVADPALRQRLEELVASSTEADLFFGVPPLQHADVDDKDPVPPIRQATRADENSGTIIGRYKLLEKIGEGGMGVVYMAEQEEPVRRKVALKIIKLGMDTQQVVARFEAERQALALMDHPNIAKVLDGGATDTGRPYFVMELVTGVPITEFCDKNQLSTEDRLKLFIPVCQAIQSAHQKGIIHRDLKPTNILVTLNAGVPHPMVIDFGVAKATQQKLTEKTVFTNYATMIGTPAHMSPEQAEMSRLDVDTRSDIYGLGVLLYELLTGTTPFPEKRLRSASYQEMQRIIMEEEPERPSTRLRLKASTPSLPTGHSPLATDLDWIVMKCLEKVRARRYETANGLATDLQRHLNNETVAACHGRSRMDAKRAV
jgi:serine/threonine protein kinase